MKENNLIGLFVPCDQFVNMMFDPELFIGQLKCLFDSENVY